MFSTLHDLKNDIEDRESRYRRLIGLYMNSSVPALHPGSVVSADGQFINDMNTERELAVNPIVTARSTCCFRIWRDWPKG